MRTEFFAVLLSCSVSAVAQADLQDVEAVPGGQGTAPASSEPATAEAEMPGERLREGVGKMMTFLKQDETPAADEIAAFLDGEIAPFFDFEYMAQVASGPMHRNMSGEQRARMTETIKQRFLETLAQRLSGYDDQGVHFLSSRVNDDGRTGAASVALMNPRGYPARIDFRFYKNSDQWRVFDVLANGQSVVAHYRREFRRMMRPGRGMHRPMRGYGPGQYR